MALGAVALQSTGYRVLLHSKEDINRLGEQAHHRGLEGDKKLFGSGNSVKPIPVGKPGEAETIVLHSHAYEMRFLNANKNATVLPDKPLPTTNNYFIGNDPSKWASNCRTFQGVTYKNMYPGIDVRYYTANGTLKYDIIVGPGADVNNIAMYFEGVESLKVKDGALHIKTSVDEVIEMAPYTYQLTESGRTEIPCSFDVKGNIVRFKLEGNYTKNSTLVIDPSLVFSTFTGSTADNWGYTATYDGKGNFYAGGIVFESGQFPVSNGAFQQSYQGGNIATGENGGFDIAIMKFDPTGSNRIYATYLGGSKGNEQPHSMVVDASGNLVIAGRTSSSDYPLVGPLKTFGPMGGLQDIIVTKLNATGTALVGSVKIGGSGNDGVNIHSKYAAKGAESLNRNYGDDARSEVILDAGGNVYFASCTQSTDFPVDRCVYPNNNRWKECKRQGAGCSGAQINAGSHIRFIQRAVGRQ
jgi:hypothetical protein